MADNKTPDLFDDINWDLNTDFGSSTDADIDLDSLLVDLNLALTAEEKSRLEYLAEHEEEAAAPQTKSAPIKHAATPPERPARHTQKPLAKKEAPQNSSFASAVYRYRKIINSCLCLIALVLIGSIAALVLLQGNGNASRIPKNTFIAGMDVGGMKAEKAVKKLNETLGNNLAHTDMVVSLGDSQIVFKPAFTHVTLQTEEAVNAAIASKDAQTVDSEELQQTTELQGMQSEYNEVDLKPYLTIDQEYLRSILADETRKIGGDYVPSGYVLEGQMPSLYAETFDETAPCQTLKLTIGHPGSDADLDAIVDTILDAYCRNEYAVTIPNEKLADYPEKLDLDAIHAELTLAPVEAEEDKETHIVTSGSCGYTFSLEEARKMVADAKYGDVVSISMEYTKPANLDLFGDFPEILGTYSTAIGSDEGYNSNMALLCEGINGTILQPGETFSFKSSFISRTGANGFVSAPIHDKYCTTKNTKAGGDQVASTLYVCAIYADLQITERHNPDHACGYTMRGTELTVSELSEDLRFRNNRKEPIQIRAKVTDSQVVIRIFGQTAPTYYTTLEVKERSNIAFKTVNVICSSDSGYQNEEVIFEGLTGGQMQLSRVKYDIATQKEISRSTEGYFDVKPASKLVAQVR